MPKSIGQKELMTLAKPREQEVMLDWLRDGRSVAIYQNKDLSHPQCGHRKFLTYGVFGSWFGPVEEPPDRLPDTPDEGNWRYTLEAICSAGAS